VHRARVEIGLHCFQIEVEHAERLRAVDEREHAALARGGADFCCREQVAGVAVDVSNCDELRAGGHRLREQIDVSLGAGMRVDDRDRDDGESKALGLEAPGVQVAWVVVGPDDDFVAGLEVEAARHEVVAFAGVARDDDLVGRHPQRLGEEFARFGTAFGHQFRPNLGRGTSLVEARVLFHGLD
jgi:hypothetical protein